MSQRRGNDHCGDATDQPDLKKKKPSFEQHAEAPSHRPSDKSGFLWMCAVCKTVNQPQQSVCQKCLQCKHAPPVVPMTSSVAAGNDGGHSSNSSSSIRGLPSMDAMVQGFMSQVSSLQRGAAADGSAASNYSSGIDEWACRACSFVNADGGGECAMCYAPRQRLDIVGKRGGGSAYAPASDPSRDFDPPAGDTEMDT